MKMERYVPDGANSCQSVVRNSRFLAFAVPVSNAAEARRLVAEKRGEHPGCNHVVFAFITGGANTENSGMSDDGEPKGTAARPVMEVLKGSLIINVLVMVVRYFGGTKLGTGGLVKAYGDCARDVLAGLPVKRLVQRREFRLEMPYNLHEKIRDAILEAGGEIDGVEYADLVVLTGRVPEDSLADCRSKVEDISRGAISL